MKAIERVVTSAANGLAVVGLTILLCLATFTLLDGLLRSLANYPLDFVREVGEMIAAIAGATCLPIALLKESNIVLKALGDHMPAPIARALDIFAAIVIEVVVLGMAWQFYLLAVKTMQAGEVTWLYNIPKAPFWFIVDAILWVGVVVQAFVLASYVTGTRKDTQTEVAL